MISNLEGFPESIKFLNKAQDWNVTAPLLSDVIYSDQQNRVIVEQILEPYLNYYVVKTWDEASRAVEEAAKFCPERQGQFLYSF